MLYSVNFKLQDKDFTIKIGTRQIIKLQDENIDINSKNLVDVFKIVHMCLVNNSISLDDFIDLYDDSDLNIEDLTEILDKAIELGINKGKKKLKQEMENQ
jgi:hypothetical protein